MLEDTEKVLQTLSGTSGWPDEAILIGGTALSILEKHRLSEDLDFIILSEKLPQKALENLARNLRSQGVAVQDALTAWDVMDAENHGNDIREYQQDYLINDVKVTFATLEQEQRAVVSAGSTVRYKSVNIADSDTIFHLKSQLLTKRAASRDIFDLYYLTHDRGRPVNDIFESLKKWSPGFNISTVKSRLLHSPLRQDDPGYEALVDKNLSIEDIRSWFQEQVNILEQKQAEKALNEPKRSRKDKDSGL